MGLELLRPRGAECALPTAALGCRVHRVQAGLQAGLSNPGALCWWLPQNWVQEEKGQGRSLHISIPHAGGACVGVVSFSPSPCCII